MMEKRAYMVNAGGPTETKLKQASEITRQVQGALKELGAHRRSETARGDLGFKYESSRYTVGEEVRHRVAVIVQFLNQISNTNESSRLLAENPAFLLARQEAVVDCWRMLQKTILGFSDIRAGSDGSSGLWESCELDYADALRRYGAIASDLYRKTSDITYHIKALECEIEAARIVMAHVEREIESDGDPSLIDLLKTPSMGYVADVFNALAVSSYRLKRYDIALPLSRIAVDMLDRARWRLSLTTAGRVERNYGVICYSFAHDYYSGGVYRAKGNPENRCGQQGLIRNEGLEAAEARYGRRKLAGWQDVISYAECKAELGRYEEARKDLECIRDEILIKQQGNSSYMGRCAAVLARVYFALAQDNRAAADPSGTSEKKDALLLDALRCAVESFEITIRFDGPSHLDVKKRFALIVQIVGALTACEGMQDDAHLVAFSDLFGEKYPELDENDDIFQQITARQLCSIGEKDRLLAGQLLDLLYQNRFALTSSDSPTQIANRIVRGEDVPIEEMLGLGGCPKIRGILSDSFKHVATQWGKLSVRRARDADVQNIFDLMVKAQKLAKCSDFYVISDIPRIRRKLEGDSVAYVAYDGDRLAAFYICIVPGLDETENIGYDVGLSEDELKRVLCMDSVAVDPEYRGRGLQRRLAKLGEEEGLKRGLNIFIATVDPRNTHSLINFLLDGYEIVLVKEGYYTPGVPRAVVMKRLDGKPVEMRSSSAPVTLS